ncbi:MAG TPA: DNA polymerase III subunit delta' [Nocardioidaceae bacterium]|nr:DNA polymerase III subunit delta' [Nocardioidaceae bacterium]
MSVWDALVGQDPLVAVLRAAVDEAARGDSAPDRPAAAMSHAWLVTGPPGSGRSTMARAFAAALQCERGGCGECRACRTVLAGTHPDVTVVDTDVLSVGVEEARDLALRAALAPAGGRWQVVIVEDADRLTESAANALLKSIEEPAAHTIWVLCAPSPDPQHVPTTIVSRCRPLVLRTPPTAAVAEHLASREAVPASVAAFAARASQGHIGLARALALDEFARRRRQVVLRIPAELRDLGTAMASAANLADAARDAAAERSEPMDARELAALEAIHGAAGERALTSAAPARKELERSQRLRSKRMVLDALDRALVDLATFYRDLLVLQLGAEVSLVNEESRTGLERFARDTQPEHALAAIDAIFATREALVGQVAPQLALESLLVSLAGLIAA